jgi:vitamin B12 transporter
MHRPMLLLSLAAIAVAGLARAEDRDDAVDVVVQGDALLPTSATDPTAATTVLQGDDLRRPGQSTAEALSRAPGVQIARSGAVGELATASLRGATTAETPIYLGGVRLNDDVTGTADLATLPLFSLRRVEVWRGANPPWVDRPGLAGAILLEPEIPRGHRVGVAAGAGSFGQRFAWVGGSVGDERAAAALSVRGEGADNDYTFVDDRGTRFDAGDDVTRERFNADVRSGDAWALARVAAGRRSTLHFALNGYLREQGVTSLSVAPARFSRAISRRELVMVSSVSQCGPDRAPDDCRFEVHVHGLRTSYQLTDPLLELGFGSTSQITRGQRFGEDARISVQLGDALRLEGGGGVSYERMDVAPVGLETVRARRSSTRAHAEVVVTPWEPLELRGSAIVTHDATVGEGAAADDVLGPMGRVAARVAATSFLAFTAGGARYVRVPTLGEAYGASAVLRGNPDLLPETGVSFDVGARAAGGERDDPVRASGAVTGFARFAEDLVAYRRTSIGGVRPFNVGTARVMGVELEAALDLVRHVRAEVALTLLDPRDTDSGVTSDLLPYVARLVAAPGIEVYADEPFASAPVVERLSLATRLVARGERVGDAAGLVVLPAQTWLDLDGLVSLSDDRIAIRARVANLLDDDATDTIGLPLPGRSFHIAGEAWWN